jgi:hypothetical protein
MLERRYSVRLLAQGLGDELRMRQGPVRMSALQYFPAS